MIIHERKGRGLVNKIINKLPFELHIPGYSYCGPGTNLGGKNFESAGKTTLHHRRPADSKKVHRKCWRQPFW